MNQVQEQNWKLPHWFQQPLPKQENLRVIKNILSRRHLHTVCESALCPNLGTCWDSKISTFMILGDHCTRFCKFCAITKGTPLPLDPQEPQQIALMVQELNLKYVVITSVTRDDLFDGGAQQFVNTVKCIRTRNSKTAIELLIPDFQNSLKSIKKVVDSKPAVVGHNMETIERLSHKLRPQADYVRSLKVLKTIKHLEASMIVKSGFMVGLGETHKEVIELMSDLLLAGCDILTIGQYLNPKVSSDDYYKVQEFVSPEKFEEYRFLAKRMGFKYVYSGPLIRSSYLAEKGYQKCLAKIKKNR